LDSEFSFLGTEKINFAVQQAPWALPMPEASHARGHDQGGCRAEMARPSADNEARVRRLEMDLKHEREQNREKVLRIAALEAELAATSERLAAAETMIARFMAQGNLRRMARSRPAIAAAPALDAPEDNKALAKGLPCRVDTRESAALRALFDAMPDRFKDECISLSKVRHV